MVNSIKCVLQINIFFLRRAWLSIENLPNLLRNINKSMVSRMFCMKPKLEFIETVILVKKFIYSTEHKFFKNLINVRKKRDRPIVVSFKFGTFFINRNNFCYLESIWMDSCWERNVGYPWQGSCKVMLEVMKNISWNTDWVRCYVLLELLHYCRNFIPINRIKW